MRFYFVRHWTEICTHHIFILLDMFMLDMVQQICLPHMKGTYTRTEMTEQRGLRRVSYIDISEQSTNRYIWSVLARFLCRACYGQNILSRVSATDVSVRHT